MSKKDAYVDKARARIDEKVAQLDELKAKVDGEVAEKKIEGYERIERLESDVSRARSHLKEISEAAEDAWEDVAGRFERLADDMSASIKKFFS